MDLVARGIGRYNRGDAAGAVADFDEALRADPRRAEAHSSRGVVRHTAGDVAGALADFDEALRADPRHAETFCNRAAARHASGDADGAMADLDRAVALRPDLAAVWSSRGAVRLAIGDLTGAIADFDAAIAIDPRHCRAYIGRGNARYHRRDPAGYLDHRAAFALDPQLAARSMVEVFLAYSRDAEQAFAECAAHLRRSPDDVAAYLKRGVILLLLGREAEAEPDFEQFRARNPKGRANLDRILFEAKRRPLAS